MADLNKSIETNQNNPQLELVNVGNSTKEDLVEGLSGKIVECPYPNHKGYSKVRDTLSPKQQKEMKESIRVKEDGKIEIIKMKKKFSMLTAQHNGKGIFDGGHIDRYGNTGIHGVTYLSRKAAKEEIKKQDKKLLKDISEVEQFIRSFPGKNTKEKISNFVELFDLERSGFWFPRGRKRSNVGPIGCVRLADVDEEGDICGTRCIIKRYNGGADISLYGQEGPSPFLASEDC